MASRPAIAPTPLDDALTATRLAYSTPAQALALAAAALVAAPTDAEVAAVVGRARGMAAAARGDLLESVRLLRRTISYAARAALPVRAAEARGSLAYVLVLTGRGPAALHELDLAEADVPDGVSGARLRMQRGLVLSELRRVDRARAALEEALVILDRAGGDDGAEADIRNNLAIVQTARLDWPQVMEQLDRAEMLYTRAGLTGRSALVWHNRAIALGLQGEVPTSLAAFDESARRYDESGMAPGALAIDRAESLLSAGLVTEAREEAESAAREFVERGNGVDLVQARVILAEACLLDADPGAALREAAAARRAAGRQGRPGWAALAAFAELRAREIQGASPRRLIRDGRRVAADLHSHGWPPQAMDALVLVARSAVRSGQVEESREALDAVRGARRRGPAAVRVRAWHAEAMYRSAAGDDRGAASAVRAGLRIVEDFRASLGATDLRAHVSVLAADLAGLRLGRAIASGRATEVLAASETYRAAHLWLRPVRPPDDVLLAGDLAALRSLEAERRAAEVSPREALTRQVRLERAVRDRARHAPGTGRTPGTDRPPDAGTAGARVQQALGDRALLEFVVHDRTLHVVVLGSTDARLVDLGPVEGVAADVDALRSGVRWLGQPALPAGSQQAARALVRSAGTRLEERLIAPTGIINRSGPLVVVPTGPLTALPWAALAGLAHRPVAVSPSAGLWLAAETRAAAADRRAATRAVFAAGPGLVGAEDEIDGLRAAYGHGVFLGPEAATVRAVLEALDGAGLAHIAAHGRFRADNPMFSALSMADGPLTVHDLERLERSPDRVVLAACDTALGRLHAGHEVIGMAASLLALGTTTLVAPLLPVPDGATRRLMLALHRHLRDGLRPSVALVRAGRETTAAGRADDAAVAAAFTCLGAG